MAVVVALVGLALAGRVVLLRIAIDGLLAAHELEGARYHVASVGLGATRITDIEIGEALAADELVLRYSPLRLLGLRIDEVAVSGLHLDLSGDRAAAFGRLFSTGDDADAAASPPADLPRLQILDGSVRLPGEIELSVAGITASVSPDGAGYAVAASTLTAARGGQRMTVEGLTADIRAQDPGAQPAIRFALASLAHEADKPLLAPFAWSGTVARRDGVWTLAATATGPHAVRLDLSVAYGEDGTVRGRLSLPVVRFAPQDAQPAELIPALATLQAVSGAASGQVAVRWHAGRPVVAEGAVQLDELAFTAGGLPVEELTARLALSQADTGEPVIRIERAQMALAGGRIEAADAAFKPFADSNRLTLRISDLDLSLLLEAFDLEGVSGEGAFTGALPLVIAGDDVAIEGGKLQSEGPGVLRIASPDTAAALAQGGADTNLLLQALADFHYERLALTLDKPLDGESRLTLAMLGHNPAVLDAHPFQINVTVTTNLDKILGAVAQGSRLSQDILRGMVGPRH